MRGVQGGECGVIGVDRAGGVLAGEGSGPCVRAQASACMAGGR